MTYKQQKQSEGSFKRWKRELEERPHIVRFMEKVDQHAPNGCWLWTGARKKTGYGMVIVNRKEWATHRFAYTFFKAPIPDGMCVCHTCDIRLCVNPAHLWVGSHSENIKDMHKKGRFNHVRPAHYARGDAHQNMKYTEAFVASLKADWETHTEGELAIMHNLNKTAVHHLLFRR